MRVHPPSATRPAEVTPAGAGGACGELKASLPGHVPPEQRVVCGTRAAFHRRGPAIYPALAPPWPPPCRHLVSRQHCCKGCQGRVLRSIQVRRGVRRRCPACALPALVVASPRCLAAVPECLKVQLTPRQPALTQFLCPPIPPFFSAAVWPRWQARRQRERRGRGRGRAQPGPCNRHEEGKGPMSACSAQNRAEGTPGPRPHGPPLSKPAYMALPLCSGPAAPARRPAALTCECTGGGPRPAEQRADAAAV